MPASPRRHAPPPRQLVDVAEAAEYAGVGERTIRRWITTGQITGLRLGPKLIRIDLAELDRLARPVAARRGDVA